MSKSDLNILSLKDLKKISQISKIPYSNLSKKDLIESLYNKFKENDKLLYPRIKKLGVTGKDGTVFLVRNKKLNEYALKQFKPNKSSKLIEKEAKFLELASKNGISPKIIYLDLDSKYIVMELLHQSLFDILKNTQGIMSIYHQRELVNLIKKLDEIGIYHGDPSPLNFLFDNKNNLKVIDFGFTEKIDQKFILKHKTKTPNQKFMLLGFILKMKSLGVDVNRNYNYIKDFIDPSDLKKCDILLNS